jgi:hypothetical protein
VGFCANGGGSARGKKKATFVLTFLVVVIKIPAERGGCWFVFGVIDKQRLK